MLTLPSRPPRFLLLALPVLMVLLLGACRDAGSGDPTPPVAAETATDTGTAVDGPDASATPTPGDVDSTTRETGSATASPVPDGTSPPEDTPPRGPPGGELRVTFLDVGQGDATLLQTPDATILIDAGRHDHNDVVPALTALGVEVIDVLLATHAHADHIGQFDRVLAQFPVLEVWMSGTPHTTQTFARALAAVEASGALYEEPRAGDVTSVGSLVVEVLNPVTLVGSHHADGLVLRISFGAVSFLFTGDAEAPTEAAMLARDGTALRSTVYQVGHHGSRTSTTATFLDAVAPAVAVYSAGRGNSFGHPHAEVVERIVAAGVDLYGTDVHGAVTVTTDGVSWAVTTTGGGPPLAVVPGGSSTMPSAPTATPSTATSGTAPAGSGCGPGQVDINMATAEELQMIVHIGPARAAAVIAARPFARVADLTRISGISVNRLAEIQAQGVACVG